MADITQRGADALRLAKALRDAAGDKTSNKRLAEIIRILWKHKVFRGLTPERLVAVMQDLGPTFVKIGQIMSARADLFPPEYCDALAKLRSEATPMSFEQVERELDNAYDGDWHRVFSSLDAHPLGSASVAQVHKAVLADGGQTVAVKVRRPGIKKKMVDDVRLLRRANDMLEVASSGDVDVSQFVDEVENTVKHELDFRSEAKNLREFHANCENVEGVSSPNVYDDLTSEAVLVMDYVEGVHADDADAMAKMDVDAEELGRLLTQDYIKQLLDDGLFHADPHTGNIIVQPGPQVVWIDMGMMGRMDQAERRLLRRMFFAVAARDARRMKDVLLVWGRAEGDVDQAKLLRDLDAMLVRYASSGIAEIDLVAAMNDLLALIRDQHIQMPASFAILARSIITFEGTLEALSPDTSIIGAINDYMERHLLDDLDGKEMVQQAALYALTLARDARDLPNQVSEILDGLLKGETRIQVGVRDLERPLTKLESTIDRMTLGLIIGGLFIGSSLLCMTQMQPMVFGIPLIGFLGYLGALALSIYVVFKGRP